MIPLYTKEEFENAKSDDKLLLKCEYCGEKFHKSKKMIKYLLDHPDNMSYKDSCKYCSVKCRANSQKKKIQTNCTNCGKTILIDPHEKARSKSGNHFCSKSCAATYNNKHKTHGKKRSKLEKYLELKLSELYPNLEILYNSKEIINSELDIYIPKHNLAFELNGIFHYEPIFGTNKLEKIQNNDKNKFQLCQENNISLCIIDTSALKYFKEQNAEKYLDIISDIISKALTEGDSNP